MSRVKTDWRQGFIDRIDCRVCLDEPLAKHTTLGVGGAAKLLVFLKNEESLSEALRFLDSRAIDWRVLGLGSNILVSDSGLSGAAFRLSGQLASLKPLDRSRRFLDVQVGAGLAMGRLIAWALKYGGGGLHPLVGIPGTIGGAIKTNAGTSLGTITDRLVEVRILRRKSMHWVPVDSLAFGYRCSPFGLRQIIVAARFRLPLTRPTKIERAYQAARQKRIGQPKRVRSAGCFFKNPQSGSAGRLIDQAGCKGARRGSAMVSTVHANYIINNGGASAKDILRLSQHVARTVKLKMGVRLEREVELWGRFRPAAAVRRSK
ncbi:MAG: UDP-N-acetylmuramate dehydrogenase [Deltaproteobacteria bacterium]|nr:UDP-N-acetylmuramate dehydrogenase [Deltaproteobacteria bacterium]